MRKVFSVLFLTGIFFFDCFSFPVKALETSSDPQYVVMNFATINELNWSAPEDIWIQEIKPKIIAQIEEMRSSLVTSADSQQIKNSSRLLAWSTLMEYMNFPMDTPSSSSPYAIKMRRILQISDELNLPLFIPLNGFQWWDQLPELYNWWDSDGTKTDPAFFSRQKNPTEFKVRFIAGYNPDNKWNVEWQDYQTPMKLNFRNWGGGGFRLAPPPNLNSSAYRTVLTGRLKVIINELLPFLSKWYGEGRENLFAGLSLGTEISLNASVRPDDEFLPYGFRAVQDQLCPDTESTCGTTTKFSLTQIDTARRKAINTFLVDLTRWVNTFAIPKTRIYTHVWGETTKDDPRHVNYADAAYTLYSRPGMSFYRFAENPLSSPDWNNMLEAQGQPAWGAIEYFAGQDSSPWEKGLANSFDAAVNPAKIMVIYNWQEFKATAGPSPLRSFLSHQPANPTCILPEIYSITPLASLNPNSLEWKFTGKIPDSTKVILHIKTGIKTNFDSPNIFTLTLAQQTTEFKTPSLPYGKYSWYIEMIGCEKKVVTSAPQTIILLPHPANDNPSWVEWILNLETKLKAYFGARTPKSP